MGKLKVDRLTVSNGSSVAIYDRSKVAHELFLEDTDDLDVFQVTLVAGTYSHSGQEVEEGAFEVDLSVGGSCHGHVLHSMADRTPDGEPGSVTLKLKVER